MLHQRRHQAHKAAGMAAGVGDPLGPSELFPQAAHLREAVDPVVAGAVGRGGVDDDGVGIGHHGRRFHRRRIRQAQEGHVRLIEKCAASSIVLAELLADLQ